MKKSYVLVALIASGFLYAQSIQGKLVYEDKKQIADSEIVLFKGTERISGITDTDGTFNIKLKEGGDYKVDIFKDGNQLLSEYITIDGNVIKDFRIPLSKIADSNVKGVTVTGRKKLIERKS